MPDQAKRRFTPEPGSPGALLDEAIERMGITKTEAGERIGEPYYTVLRWCKNEGFNVKNQRRAAMALGLALDAFESPDLVTERELERQRELHAFLRRPIARSLTPEARKVLESVRFVDASPRPSVAFYEAMALLLLNQIEPEEASELAEYNDAIDRTPSYKRR